MGERDRDGSDNPGGNCLLVLRVNSSSEDGSGLGGLLAGGFGRINPGRRLSVRWRCKDSGPDD